MAKKKHIPESPDLPDIYDAHLAMKIIKGLEKDRGSSQEIDFEIRKNEAMKKMVEEKVQKNLRERLLKKEEEKKNRIKIIKNLEIGKTIKWSLKNNGYLFEGYLKDELRFIIKKSAVLFSLYEVESSPSKKTYKSCSTNLELLKQKSEKLIKLI